MEQNVPNWINHTFVTTILEKSSIKNADDIVKIINFTIHAASTPGNNYMSKIYRVKVEFEVGVPPIYNAKSFIVKVPLADGFMKDLNDSHNCYDKEPKMYEKLLPNLCKKANCNFGPSFFPSPVKNVLVMEDLIEEGYSVCDKFKQLDYLHCKLVFEKLALFHASSVAYFHENPSLVLDVGKELFWTEGSPVEPMVKPSLEYIAQTVSGMKGLEEFAEYLNKRVDQIWTLAIEIAKPKLNGGFNVLNHGDLWTNNVLFRYNKAGVVADAKIIDFQVTRFGSPASDLLYFVWTSANDNVRGKRQKELFHIYLHALNANLEKIGCVERLSLEEFNSDLKMAADWALLTIAHLLPYMMAEVEDVPDFAALSVDDFQSEAVTKIYKGKTFNNLLLKVVKDYVKFFFKQNDLLN